MISLKKYQNGIIAFCLVVSLAVPPSLVLSVGMSFVDAPLAYAAGEVPVPAPAGESSGAEQSYDPDAVIPQSGSGSSVTRTLGNTDYGPGGYIVDGALSAASGSESNYSSDGSSYSSDGSNYSSDGSSYSSEGSNYSSDGSNYSSDGSSYSSDGSNYSSDGSSDLMAASSYSSEGSVSDVTSAVSNSDASSDVSSGVDSEVVSGNAPAEVSSVNAYLPLEFEGDSYSQLSLASIQKPGPSSLRERYGSATDPATGALSYSFRDRYGNTQTWFLKKDASGTIESITYTISSMPGKEYVYTGIQPYTAGMVIAQGFSGIGYTSKPLESASASSNLQRASVSSEPLLIPYIGQLKEVRTYEMVSTVSAEGVPVVNKVFRSSVAFTYQPNGFLSGKTETVFGSDSGSQKVTVSTYGPVTGGSSEALRAVNVYEGVTAVADPLKYTLNTVYTYDDRGRLITSVERQAAVIPGSPTLQITTSYDVTTGRAARRDYMDLRGNISYRWEVMTYEVTAGGGVVTTTTVSVTYRPTAHPGLRADGKGTDIAVITKIYDASGRLVKEIIKEPSDPSDLLSAQVQKTRFTDYDAITGAVTRVVTCLGLVKADTFPDSYFMDSKNEYAASVDFKMEFFDAAGNLQWSGDFQQGGGLGKTTTIQINQFTIVERIPQADGGVEVTSKTYSAFTGVLASSQSVSTMSLISKPVLKVNALPQKTDVKLFNARNQLVKEVGENLRAADALTRVTTFYAYREDGSMKEVRAFAGELGGALAPEVTTNLLIVDHYEQGVIEETDRYIAGQKDNTTFYIARTQLFDVYGKQMSTDNCNIRYAGVGGRLSDLLSVYKYWGYDNSGGESERNKYKIVKGSMFVFDTFNNVPGDRQWGPGVPPREDPPYSYDYLSAARAGTIINSKMLQAEIPHIQGDQSSDAENLIKIKHLREYVLYGENSLANNATLPNLVKRFDLKPDGTTVAIESWIRPSNIFNVFVPGINYAAWWKSTDIDLKTRVTLDSNGYSAAVDNGAGLIWIDSSNLDLIDYTIPVNYTTLISYDHWGTRPGEFLTRSVVQKT